MPITDLSDEELKSLYKPQNEQSSGISSVSDEELLNMYNQNNSENTQVLTGGVEQKVIPNWDKKGRIYYTDEQGNKIKSNVPLSRKIGNKIKATATNIGDWLTTDVGEKAKERRKAVALLTTAPIGVGAGIGGMALSGALGGGLYSGAEQAIEGKFNPKQLATDIGLGAATGSLLGLGGKYIVSPIIKNISRRSNIAKRRATPLAERMTEEQLENIKQPETDYYKEAIQKLKENPEIINTNDFYNNVDKMTEQQQISFFDEVDKTEKLLQNKKQLNENKTIKQPSLKGIIEKEKKESRKIARSILQQATGYKKVDKRILDSSKGIDRLDNAYANDRITVAPELVRENPDLFGYVDFDELGADEKVINRCLQILDEGGVSPTEIENNLFDRYYGNIADEVIPEQVIQSTGETKLRSLPQSVLDNEAAQRKLKTSTLAQKAEKSTEVAKAIKENPTMYEAITNADTMLQAQNEISQNASKVHTDTIRKLVDENAEVTALDVEKARQIFNELQKQGRFDEATDLLELTSRQGSKLGQAVQAFSLWSKTTPDGAMLYAQKLLDKYNKGVRKNLQKRLTENELKEIGEAFQKLNESGLTGRKLEVETAKAMKKVFKVVPKTFAQKLDGYRYINMLLSGKSRIKDFLLTGKNAFDTAIDETIAGGIDAARSALSKDKTRYISANPFSGTKAWFQGAKKGLNESLEDIRLGINTSRSGEVGRYGLPSEPIFNMPTFEGNLANRIMTAVKNPLGTGEKLLRYTMQVPDRMFFEARYASSLANQMKVRGVKEPTQDMINRAVEEAKRAVFQENRPITEKMTEAAKFLDTPVNIIEDVVGLPKGTLPSVEKGLTPFVKTPTNVIAQGAEGLHGAGSGLLSTIKAVEQGNPEAIREAELLMGRGVRGLGELGLGYAVGKNIIDNIKTNIGEKDYYANEITGLKPNSIVIGDKAISLQNMQNNLPFFSGIGLGQKGLGQAFINTGDVIAEMPALKALGDLYNINKEAKYIAQSDDADKELLKTGSRALRSLGANYLTSLIPYGGALGELRNDIDPNARELYMPDLYDENTLSGLGSDLSYLGNRLVNRLPFGSSTLPARYNALGEPIMVNNIKNPVGRVLSEAIDFGIRNYNERPAEMKEMQRLQDYAMENNLDGKTTLKFAKPKRYLGRGKDKIKLNNKQYSELTRLYGSKVYDELQFLMNTPEYQSQDDETKIKWVREVLKEKKKEAEEEIFDIIEQ